MSIVRVGVVGLGWPGRKHIESLASIEDAEVVAVADLDADRRRAFAPAGARVYSDWRAMLEGEPGLDAVVLATPPRVRLEPITGICERGLALFCEKPAAHDLDTARRVADLVDRSGILNSVGFMYRWAPLAERLKELIHGRAALFARIVVAWPVLGWVAEGRAPKGLLRKAEAGGPLVEQGVHFQDILRFITADEPTEVMAMADLGRHYPTAERDAEETSVVIVRHASGMLTSHVHNWSHGAHLLQLQLVGVDYDLTWSIHAGPLVGRVGDSTIDERDDTDPYYAEMAGFVAAVRDGDPKRVRSTYRDATRTLAVCDAAARAVDHHRLEAVAAI